MISLNVNSIENALIRRVCRMLSTILLQNLARLTMWMICLHPISTKYLHIHVDDVILIIISNVQSKAFKNVAILWEVIASISFKIYFLSRPTFIPGKQMVLIATAITVVAVDRYGDIDNEIDRANDKHPLVGLISFALSIFEILLMQFGYRFSII